MTDRDFRRYTLAYWDEYPKERKSIQGEHLQRLRLGVEKWNKWAKDFSEWMQEEEITDAVINLSGLTITHSDFSNYRFPVTIVFDQAQFSGTAFFREAQFSDQASFTKAQFSGAASFFEAQFHNKAFFDHAEFDSTADFDEAQFSDRAYFTEAQFSGTADFIEAQFSDRANFTKAQFSGAADFREAQFHGPANFGEAQFSGTASFIQAQFKKQASFVQAQFSDRAYFDQAQFSGMAYFTKAQFSDQAYFSQAQFSGTAYFDQAQFSDMAYFNQAQFGGAASFLQAQFKKEALFININANTLILEQAQFTQVPDFRYSTFASPPYLSNVVIPGLSAEEDDNVIKYRKLKALAIQAHDHQKELEFFAYEAKAKRGVETEGLQSLPEYLFEWFSNFGQSIVRPLMLIVAAWLFGLIALYIVLPEKDFNTRCAETIQPSAETAQPSAETAQPSAETTQPSAETTQPNAETTQPSAETTQPSAETTQPSAETTQPSAETAQPSAETAQPSAETTLPKLLHYAARRATHVSFPTVLTTKEAKQAVNRCLFKGGVPGLVVIAITVMQQILSIAGFFFFGLGLRNRFKIK